MMSDEIKTPDNEIAATPEVVDLAATWGIDLRTAICEGCDWAYLLPGAPTLPQCPHCFQQPLAWLAEGLDQLPYTHPPEMRLPFTLSEDALIRHIQAFAGKINFAPPDLTPQQLLARLQQLYLPRWLVDSDVQALWQAEMGFDYEVVSHQDRYDQKRGGWVSREVTETRVRWEPRVGRLARTYHNVVAPALEEDPELKRRLGGYDLKPVRSYQAGDLAGAIVRLPNRPPKDAWPDAKPHFKDEAAGECRQAARANHIRQFRWQARYSNLNWTQLLLPVYSTYYLDDDRKPQVVLIHGQSGRVSGARRASLKRARRMALIIAGVAVAIFLGSGIAALVALFEPALWGVAGLGLLMAMVVALAAIAPIAIAWEFNRSQFNEDERNVRP